MSKTLLAIAAIHGRNLPGADETTREFGFEPGDIFTSEDADRLINHGAAREASDEEIAIAKVRGTFFSIEDGADAVADLVAPVANSTRSKAAAAAAASRTKAADAGKAAEAADAGKATDADGAALV